MTNSLTSHQHLCKEGDEDEQVGDLRKKRILLEVRGRIDGECVWS